MHNTSKLTIILILTSCISACFNANKYGFTNEIDGAYTIAKEVTTPKKAVTGCNSLSKYEKEACIKGADELLDAMNKRSN